MFSDPVSYLAAFSAGLLSFFSPCIVPLIPAYFTFITGLSLNELTGGRPSALRWRVIRGTVTYVLGFTLVFVLMGASASYIGGAIYKYRDWIRIGGGSLILLFGVHLTGWIRFRPLEFERRLQVHKKPAHLGGVFVVGMAFGAGWSPCVGPLLGSILILAANQETLGHGIGLLCLYSAGLALPFLLLSVFIGSLLPLIRKASGWTRAINITAGVLLVILGLLLLSDKLHLIRI